MELTRDDVRSVAHGRTIRKRRKWILLLGVAALPLCFAILAPKESLSLYFTIPASIFLFGMFFWGMYWAIFQPQKNLETELLKEWKEHIVS